MLDGDAGVRAHECSMAAGRVELLQAGVHQVQREADRDRRNHDADHQRDLLQSRRGADDVAGFQILRGVAGVGRRDADHAADGDGQRAEGRGWSSLAQGRWRDVAISVAIVMPEIGIGRTADQAHNARADGDKQKSEDDHQQRSGKVRRPAHIARQGRA